MATPATTRDERIELRASREEKRVLAAEAIVAQHERNALSARDSARVLELLEHPPKPPAALRAAAGRRNRR